MILDFINYVNCKSGITEIFHDTLRALMRQLTSSVVLSCTRVSKLNYILVSSAATSLG